MHLFERRFHTLLEFQDLQQSRNKSARSPWHDKEARGGTAKNQHQVAMRYQGRYTGDKEFTYSGELNNKIEMIRNGSSNMQILSDLDVKHILKNYPITELPRDKPKSLSNTGMVVVWNPVKGKYILTKNNE
jgi:hypothetical protein